MRPTTSSHVTCFMSTLRRRPGEVLFITDCGDSTERQVSPLHGLMFDNIVEYLNRLN